MPCLSVFYHMHYKVGKGFEAEKYYQSSGALNESSSYDNSDVHGDYTKIWEEHDCPDVWHPIHIPSFVMEVRKPVII